MSSSTTTFAGQLRHFARSVDNVDDHIFDSVRSLMLAYVRNELGVSYFEVMREHSMDGEPGLKMFWSNDEQDHSWRIHQSDGTPTNLITRAFAEQKALWVVGQDKKALAPEAGQKLEDAWSQSEDLSPYQPTAGEPVKTLIVLPLRRKRPLGVCYLESSTYLGITDVAKTELKLLCESIAILLELYESNRSQAQLTSSAIRDLQESLTAAKFPKLAKPRFFVAFSKRADPQVTLVLSEVLRDFSDRIEFTDWSEMNDHGNINIQIANEIMRSTFGICYFSEPAPPAPDSPKYMDNMNVVFEAGMLHARTADIVLGGSTSGGGWIPIREDSSPEAPFDLATERTVSVPRHADGQLNEGRLREALQHRIENLLGEG